MKGSIKFILDKIKSNDDSYLIYQDKKVRIINENSLQVYDLDTFLSLSYDLFNSTPSTNVYKNGRIRINSFLDENYNMINICYIEKEITIRR